VIAAGWGTVDERYVELEAALDEREPLDVEARFLRKHPERLRIL
jgi:hypothetical protein